MTSFFITNICEVVFLIFFYGLWLCVCCFFQHQFCFGLSSILRSQLCFEFVHILVFSFYVMLKIDDRFRYLGHELDPRSINCFDILCFQFLFVRRVDFFCWSSMAKLIGNPTKNRATLMYVFNISNITKDVGCMF